eukprot:350781-Chlamydomonas_euryale.AAC.1
MSQVRPALLVTFNTGPVGLLVHLVTKAVVTRMRQSSSSASGAAGEDRTGEDQRTGTQGK